MCVAMVNTNETFFFDPDEEYTEEFQISLYIMIAKLYGEDGYPSSV